MSGNRGFTLIHCLLFMTLVMILGGTSFRIAVHGTLHSVRGHWDKTAEALADGALEMALAELERGGEEKILDAVLSTGIASAQILEASGDNRYRIVFQATVADERRILASRAYEAEVFERAEGDYEIVSVERL